MLNSVKQFIQDRSVAVFFLLAFTIAWLGSFLVAGPKFFRGEAIDPLNIALVMLAAPILSGILMAFIVDGKRGLGDMFSRMRKWRVGNWYLTLLIFPFLILVVSLLLSSTVSPVFTPIFFSSCHCRNGEISKPLTVFQGLPPKKGNVDLARLDRLAGRISFSGCKA